MRVLAVVRRTRRACGSRDRDLGSRFQVTHISISEKERERERGIDTGRESEGGTGRESENENEREIDRKRELQRELESDSGESEEYSKGTESVVTVTSSNDCGSWNVSSESVQRGQNKEKNQNHHKNQNKNKNKGQNKGQNKSNNDNHNHNNNQNNHENQDQVLGLGFRQFSSYSGITPFPHLKSNSHMLSSSSLTLSHSLSSTAFREGKIPNLFFIFIVKTI